MLRHFTISSIVIRSLNFLSLDLEMGCWVGYALICVYLVEVGRVFPPIPYLSPHQPSALGFE